MRISVGQIYVKPGVKFPFSHIMQRWLGEHLSSSACPRPEFLSKYGAEFDVVIRVSADTGIRENRLKGPTVFKKEKDVEYTIFLPFEAIKGAPDECRLALDFLLSGVEGVFGELGIDSDIAATRQSAIDRICSDATMFERPSLS